MLIAGDARDVLGRLASGSVDSCVSSPPYWRHRVYPNGTLGNERTVEQYVEHLVEILAELKRVLVPRGLLMLNLGDSYHRKALQLVPARVALALVDDGWLLRAEIIWQKPNVRPESVKDRPTRDFEHVFMLALRPDHLFYRSTVMEPAKWDYWGEQTSPKARRAAYGASWQSERPDRRSELAKSGLRNPRSVWRIPSETRDMGGSAVMPLALAEKLVAATCSVSGTVLDPFCGTGTTLLAAHRSGRSYVGIDTDENVLEVARKRIAVG